MKQIEKFTIHFATINTQASDLMFTAVKEFTIHFATINTVTHFIQYL